jgi:hypothetical protein
MTLIGCRCFAPPQAVFNECTDEKGFACIDGTAVGQWIDPKPAAFKANPATKNVRTTTAAKVDKPSSAQFGDKADPVTRKARRTIAAKTEEAASAQIGGRIDPILKKAMSTISAKMDDPSVEFGAMNRAVRKNTLGEPMDTIAATSKGKARRTETPERNRSYISSKKMRRT